MTLIEGLDTRNFGLDAGKVPPPGKAEAELVASVLNMLEQAIAAKEPYTKIWPTVYDHYHGKHWGRRPTWKSSPVENHIFSKIETMLPILTDNRPKIDILPREGAYLEYAELVQSLLDYLWDKNSTDDEMVLACKNMLLFGKGFLYSYWCDDEQEVVTESVDPQNIFPDPDATSVKTARYLFHVAKMSRTDILATWPGAIGKVQRGTTIMPDPMDMKQSRFDDFGGFPTAGYEYPLEAGGSFARLTPWVKAGVLGYGQEDDMVQVVQCLVRDPELVEEEIKDENGNVLSDSEGNPVLFTRPKYPGGRHIVMAGSRIIHDALNPFQHGQFPYVEFNCHPFPGEFWPVSAAANLLSPQRTLNKLNGQILDNAKLLANGIWLVEAGSGVKADQIHGQPGLVVTYNRGYKVERLPGVPLPNFVIQMADMARAALDNISGVFDVTQGRKPSGITAGVAIEQLQEAAQTRLRLLVRNIENGVRDLGSQQVALCQQFYETPRTIRVTDAAGQWQLIPVTPEMIAGQWEVVVAAGSTLPRSREARQREALELFDRQIIDEEDVLNWIDFPGKDKIIQKMKERQALQAQLDSMFPVEQSAGPSGPGGTAPGHRIPREPTMKKPQVSGRGQGQGGPPPQ